MKALASKITILIVFITISSQLSMADNISTLIPKIKDAIFTVYAEDEQQNIFSSGSGFFISSSGIGITNFHVLQGAYGGRIKCTNGDEYRIKHVIDYSPQYDIVKFQVENLSHFSFPYLKTKENLPTQGEPVVSYSNPLGSFENTVSTGIVAAIRQYKNYENVIQITAPISHGSSGSPVMNNLGEVIGVATFGVESGQSLNFAVSVLQIKKLTQNKNIPVSDMQINACETPKLKRAVGCFSQNDFQNGFRLLNEEIQNNPSNHLAYYYKGLWTCRLGNLSEGVGYLWQACAMDTANYTYLEKTAEFAKNAIISSIDHGIMPTEDMIEITLALYQRCIEINPQKPDAYAGLGYFLLYMTKLGAPTSLCEHGISNLDYAISLYPNPQYYMYRAQLYSELENWGKVILDCTNALSIDNELFRAYLIRGTVRALKLYQVDEGIMDLTIAESLATTVEEKANTCLELSSAYWAKYSYANNPQKIHIRQALDYAKKAYSLDQTVDAKQQINDLQKLL